MPTPHIEANKKDIAKIVLMPGDPLRAKFIADTYLKEAKQVNGVRNMLAYTGTYKGKKVSVMGSGMGMPSIGIYSYELYSQYGVECIIRVGSAGSYCEKAKVYDVLLVEQAYSESNYAKVQNGYPLSTIAPSKEVNDSLLKAAKKLGIPLLVGGIHSSDVFYQESDEPYYQTLYTEHGCKAVEMESFALFHNAKVLGKKAACILTISDSFVDHQVTSAKERETAFTKMMEIALESIVQK